MRQNAYFGFGCKRAGRNGCLKQLVQQAGNRISIMPGACVRSENIVSLIDGTGAWECHTSARNVVENPMTYSLIPENNIKIVAGRMMGA